MNNPAARTVPAFGLLRRVLQERTQTPHRRRRPVLKLASVALVLAVMATLSVPAVAQTQQDRGAIAALTLISDTPGTVDVAWDAPAGTAPTDYRVSWARIEDDWPSWTDDTGNLYPTTTTEQIADLDEGAEYKVRVRARYHHGTHATSPWSGPWDKAALVVAASVAAVAQTQQVPGTISGLVLSSDTPGTLAVSWDASSPAPTDYRVNWAKSDESYPSWKSEAGNRYPTATSLELTGLDYGIEYKVRARARYHQGTYADNPWSGQWEEMRVRVVSPVVGPPRNVELLAGDGWLAVQWAPPEDGGDGIAEYLVQWKPAAAVGWEGPAEATVPAGRFMRTINGLANGVLYTVRVRAEPAVGEGAWSEEVTGSAAAAPPLELSLNGGLQERIVVTWQAPDSATTSSVAQYVVQWYRPRTPHDATRRMEVPVTDTQVTIFDVEADVVWWVRVSAVDALGRVLGRSEAPTLTKLASDVIEQRVVEAFEEDFPWLRQTWNVPIPVNVGGAGAAYGFVSSTNVRTVSGTNWPNLIEGLYYKFAASGQYTNNRIVMHELAHHFTLDVRVPENPASVAVGWLYFDQLVSGHCPVGEVYADVLAYHTASGRWSAWNFLAGCTQVGRPPKAEALAVVASISDGEIPQWLFDTYSTDGTADTMDLDGLWSDVKALSGLGPEVAYGLHNLFGGYCSDKEAIAANRASAPVYKNPWVQGGCETRWPRDLTAAASGSGAISVSWTAPYYATTPTINAYVVQWKRDGAQYDSARQALVTDLSSLSYTITGLISGEQYSVRVAAVNQADTADFVDDDGRTRAAETATDPPPPEPGLTVNLGSVTVTEGSATTASFEVSLATQPSADVTVNVRILLSPPGLFVTPPTLTFTPANWDTAQNVTVDASNYNDPDTIDTSFQVEVAAMSADSNYDGVSQDVAVTVTDDDTAALVVSQNALTVDENGTATFDVSLATLPSASVTVTVSSGDTAVATVTPTPLTFTNNNWSIPQSVTVTGVDDSDTNDDTATITLTASGGSYTNVTITVTAIITDGDISQSLFTADDATNYVTARDCIVRTLPSALQGFYNNNPATYAVLYQNAETNCRGAVPPDIPLGEADPNSLPSPADPQALKDAIDALAVAAGLPQSMIDAAEGG